VNPEPNNRLLRIDKISPEGNIRVKPLREHLQSLWNYLFVGAPALNCITCTVTYHEQALVPILVPILLQDLICILPAEQKAPGVLTEADLLDNWACIIRNWFKTETTTDGQLVFEIASFDPVHLDKCIPLWEWTNLTLPLSSIQALS